MGKWFKDALFSRIMECPRCHKTERQVKTGCTDARSQRFLCRYCGNKYTPIPKTVGYAASIRERAVQLRAQGLSYREIAKQLHVNHQSVHNWVQDSQALSQNTTNAPLSPLPTPDTK